MTASQSSPNDRLTPVVLVTLNVVGVLLGYATTVLIARSLSPEGFENYVGAVATLGLLASVGEAGFGKFGLKLIPTYAAKGRPDLLRGYVGFAIGGCLGFTLLLGLGTAFVEIWLRDGIAEQVILLAMVFLPSMAAAGVTVDLLSAFQKATTATVISRLVVPLTSLAAVACLAGWGQMTAFRAVLSFGGGGLVGFLIGVALTIRHRRSLVHDVRGRIQMVQWIRQGASFFAYGFISAWFFRATLFLLYHLPHSSHELAMLAPAFETGGLILLLSKSTDKYFQPTMAIFMDSGDWVLGKSIRRQRWRIMSIGIALFLSVIFVFGKRILAWYGDEFVTAYASLCIISVGASVWTFFSLAPTFLMFADQKRWVFRNLLVHGGVLTLLTILLFQSHGIRGAALAFTVSISSLSLCNFALAQRTLQRMVAVTSDNRKSSSR